MISQEKKIISHSPLFQGIDPEDIPDALRMLNAARTNYKKGQMIADWIFPHSGIVIDGTVSMQFYNKDSDLSRVITIHQGQTFGVAFALAEKEKLPMHFIAEKDCEVLLLNFKTLLLPENRTNYNCALINQNLIRMLSKRVVALQQKSTILGQKTIRDKLLVYLSYLPKDTDGFINLPVSKTALAEFLCVNRTSLEREIKALTEEGILIYQGRKVRVKE